MSKIVKKIFAGLIILLISFVSLQSSILVAKAEDVTNLYKNKIKVHLQTPFEEPPPDKDCIKEGLIFKHNGAFFVCRKRDDPKVKTGKWLQVVMGDDGSKILQDYVKLIYIWLAGFIGVVAVLMIIAGGIQISIAGADQSNLDDGKKRIVSALVGLVLLFLTTLILYTINPNFFTNAANTTNITTP